MDHRVQRWTFMFVAVASWLLATGLAVEKTLRDLFSGQGVPSWALLLSYPVLTLAVAILLHQSFKDFASMRFGYAIRGLVAFVLGLLVFTVTLPASITMSGSAKDVSLANAKFSGEELARIRADLSKTQRLVDEANRWMSQTCNSKNRSADKEDCKLATFVAQQRQASLDALSSKLGERGPVQEATSGDKRIAWGLSLLGLKADVGAIQMGLPMLPPIVFELLSAFCFVLALGAPVATAAVPTRELVKTEVKEPVALKSEEMPRRRKPRVVEEVKALPAPEKPDTALRHRRQAVVAWVAQQTMFSYQTADRSDTRKLEDFAPTTTAISEEFRLPIANASRWKHEGIGLAQRQLADKVRRS